MSSVQNLRALINERLTAAAEEIFTEFEKTIVQYEEEIDRQRRLLEIFQKPELKLHRIDVQQHVCKEVEVTAEQQFCNPELLRIKEEQEDLCTGLSQEDPEPPAIKEEQDELCAGWFQEGPESSQMKEKQLALCTSQEGAQLMLNWKTDTFIVTPTYVKNNNSKPKPNNDQLLLHNSPVLKIRDLEGSKAFQKNSHMEKHPKIQTGKQPYPCSICGKSISFGTTLKVHMRTHTDEKPYLCNTHGRAFSVLSAIKRRNPVQTGEKRYSCKTCGKRFRRSGHLTEHMRTHTGEKPYSCEICGKGFSRHYGLMIHVRSHTGEKPYACKMCDKRYKDASALKKHIRSHTVLLPL